MGLNEGIATLKGLRNTPGGSLKLNIVMSILANEVELPINRWIEQKVSSVQEFEQRINLLNGVNRPLEVIRRTIVQVTNVTSSQASEMSKQWTRLVLKRKAWSEYLGQIEREDEDLYYLARIIYGEARGEPHSGKLAVGWVIQNRLTTLESSFCARGNPTYRRIIE